MGDEPVSPGVNISPKIDANAGGFSKKLNAGTDRLKRQKKLWDANLQKQRNSDSILGRSGRKKSLYSQVDEAPWLK